LISKKPGFVPAPSAAFPFCSFPAPFPDSGGGSSQNPRITGAGVFRGLPAIRGESSGSGRVFVPRAPGVANAGGDRQTRARGGDRAKDSSKTKFPDPRLRAPGGNARANAPGRGGFSGAGKIGRVSGRGTGKGHREGSRSRFDSGKSHPPNRFRFAPLISRGDFAPGTGSGSGRDSRRGIVSDTGFSGREMRMEPQDVGWRFLRDPSPAVFPVAARGGGADYAVIARFAGAFRKKMGKTPVFHYNVPILKPAPKLRNVFGVSGRPPARNGTRPGRRSRPVRKPPNISFSLPPTRFSRLTTRFAKMNPSL
jgi:hypothetical protein